jgi:hypothetical protein
MAAGIETRLWSMEDVARLYEPKVRAKRGHYKKSCRTVYETWLIIAIFLVFPAVLGWQLWRAWKYGKILYRYGGDVVRAQSPSYFWVVVSFYTVIFAVIVCVIALAALDAIGRISN